MYAPNFAAPQSIDDAVRMLGADGAKPLSGGTDLIVQIRSGRNRPDHIVDLKKVPGLIGIKAEGAGFRVGAATSGAQLGEDKALVAAYPGIVEGAELIGSTQVQGRASLAGNLCNASPAADSVPAMAACGVKAVVVGPNGEREVAGQPRQNQPDQGRVRQRIRAASTACQFRRCLSPLHSAHRNGHRRRWRWRPDPACG